MRRVNIDDLSCGMVLAADVSCKNGRMLLAAGTAVTPAQLRVLRIWGVAAVSVVDDGDGAAQRSVAFGEDKDSDIPEEARSRLDARFALAGRGREVVDELYRFCLRQYADATRCPLPAVPPLPTDASQHPLPSLPPDPQALLADDPSLASLPDIYFRLREAIDDPRSSAGHIAGIVGTDPGLAATLLRLANSPFYGLSRPIDSLARGVMLIGAGELAQLALAVAVVDRFKDVPNACLTMRQAWEHAVGCGVLARVLACHVGGLVQETLFVAGLLHDLGRLVLLRRAPRHMARVMVLARERRVPLCDAEGEVLGFTHAAVGEALLARWRLPGQLARAVGGHHDGEGLPVEAAIVQLADAATVAAGWGYNGLPLVPPVADAALRAVNLEPGELTVALSQAERQVDDIVSTLLAG